MGRMTYRYPVSRLASDYVKAAAGLAATGGVALAVVSSPISLVLLGCLAGVFFVFGVQTAIRHGTRVTVTAADIAAVPGGVCRAWRDLTAVRLAYYSTRRDGRNGWMQLTLRWGGRRLHLDSRLDGFEDVARRAANAARANRLLITPASVANFAALGIDMSMGMTREFEGFEGVNPGSGHSQEVATHE